MPTYQYQCKKCGNIFDARRPLFGHDEDVKCPQCGAVNPQRVFTPVYSRSMGACRPFQNT